jgi:8-oxo-dGTP pyrophosphatase MutT (NUDIX family)
MRQATLVFLVKRDENGKIGRILLAMKKRGFGMGRWNGVGGKPKPDETVIQCARREAKEEIGVKVGKLNKIGMIRFRFKYNENYNQNVHFFICENWEGIPAESEEMKPRWFKVDKIPYSKMWPDDKFWMPIALQDKKIAGSILFGKDDKIIENNICGIR